MNTSQLRTITLEKIRFACGQRISRHLAESSDLQLFSDHLTDTIMAQLEVHLAGERVDTKMASFPRDWKEAVKERLYAWLGYGWDVGHWPWLGDYARRRWPVMYKEVHADIAVVYPNISMPREQHHVALLQSEMAELPRNWIDMQRTQQPLVYTLMDLYYGARDGTEWYTSAKVEHLLRFEKYRDGDYIINPMQRPLTMFGMPIHVTRMVPENVIELRNAHGEVVGKIFNIGTK